ncbi:hypothetical protein [Paenibacillus vini]|uniref:Uncharacterized protein n=1 Tax=Paenibacillus vini TaxID=1476024 RepID=A0ABQ4MIV7_9BACL|nr:hypothetical protein [Paenibacillus vini]GIP55925.1 hypothetical protein J42TS3_49600 [Paenibacillus vini]
MEDFKKLLVRCSPGMYERVVIGDFGLSIQASSTHYSSPRKTLSDAQDYNEFELAIFENDEWIDPLEDERFVEVIGLLKDRYEPGPFGVGAYIPDHIIQTVCNFIETNLAV